MDEIKERKCELEFKQSQLKTNDIAQIVTEGDVSMSLNNFKGYAISRNIPECKKFI